MNAPLQNLLVITLEQAVAAPFASAKLAEGGARVIKIERREGDFARGYDSVVDGESAYFVWLNQGKESIALDIKEPGDAALLKRMIASADVFIQNLAPGAAGRAGLGADDLRARHPSLITCDISGYGEDGAYRDMKAYDLLVQAETGLCAITGGEAEPGRVGISIADITTGMQAFSAILLALRARDRSGLGQAIKISLFDTVAELMTVPYLHQRYGGAAPQRVGMNHPSIAPYGAYRGKDGRRVVLSIQNEREWVRFCRAVLDNERLADDPRFADNESRVAHRGALDEAIASVFAALDRPEIIHRLRDAKIAFGALNAVADLQTHPQLRTHAFTTPSGTAWAPATPARITPSCDDGSARTHVPALDQHGADIRREFGDAHPMTEAHRP
ncbi:CaiB/BaiF CoA transferase family protein [Varunaivibrio sulfuroxidans]|uniref:Crotonobetainyl-CoA:carnitine CoA-transferase CaiB-like acyl-CoA transferase n=1 Tax=Varunaivibrio sulfuroxidans TaxID=1773489 RepID=A0A4R3JC30_9PROT|nr:CaiB/BaiF CoA-transferase family protein [Varunaivibrio sulfuroxidans]TCS62633.1 crotonobetainyl-CoA:carnitine CoA-transferase CaiB-like acyl-CoA transferase [Varunaivibrio sulfuroxidans]WES30700.1 CaiB/BaiF CoA-transferase family protein [Varunaivibrio sulfuroxidans]